MEGKSFAKCIKDLKLLDKNITTTDVDLVFAKVKKDTKARKISFEEFVNGLEVVAKKKGITREHIMEIVS